MATARSFMFIPPRCLAGLSPAEIRDSAKAQVKSYRDGMLAHGVDMMAYTSGLHRQPYTRPDR